jgi:hypothetical protein
VRRDYWPHTNVSDNINTICFSLTYVHTRAQKTDLKSKCLYIPSPTHWIVDFHGSDFHQFCSWWSFLFSMVTLENDIICIQQPTVDGELGVHATGSCHVSCHARVLTRVTRLGKCYLQSPRVEGALADGLHNRMSILVPHGLRRWDPICFTRQCDGLVHSNDILLWRSCNDWGNSKTEDTSMCAYITHDTASVAEQQ